MMEDDLDALENPDETGASPPPADGVARPKAKGQSAAAKRRVNIREIPCLLHSIGRCDQFQKRGSRFCHTHNCHYEAMAWQAKVEGVEVKRLFTESMKDDTVAASEVEKFSRENAGVAKHKRKGLIKKETRHEKHG